MAAARTHKKRLTLRRPATKQTRITQYLKKVKSWRAKIMKSKNGRALKWQGGIMSNKKFPMIHNVMEIHKKKDFQNAGKVTHAVEMTKMRTLLRLGDSVCKVCINGAAHATGFLLFGRCILTNGHVVRDILNDGTRQLSQAVTVMFEELSSCSVQIPVEENLIAYRYVCGSSNHILDYALLQLTSSLENLPPHQLPPALLRKCSYSQQEGQIYIIGHPGCNKKTMSISYITEYENRTLAFDKYFAENPGHLAEIIGTLLKKKWDFKGMEDPHLMTYDTSFLHGSSGSPVFQENCQLVSLHTGGYSYRKDGKSYSIIEYAIPIMPIVQDILCELLQNNVLPNHHKLDCLKEFSREALRGSHDMVYVIAWFITEVLLKLRENQIYPKALQVVLGEVKGTMQHVKTQLHKALRNAMDTKPLLKGISQQGLVKLAKTKEEHSSMDILCCLLFENQRRVLKDIDLNVLGEDNQKKKNSRKPKSRPRRGEEMKRNMLRC